MGSRRVPDIPVCLPAGHTLEEKWVDGILQIERLAKNVRRYIFYRIRTTSDGIRYREPVTSFICDSRAVLMMARQATEQMGADEIRRGETLN